MAGFEPEAGFTGSNSQVSYDGKTRTARLMKIDALLALSKLTANFPTATYYDTFAKWEQSMLKEG